MRKNFYCLIIFIIFSAITQSSIASSTNIIEVDFDKSMGIEERGRYNLMFRDKESKKIMNVFRKLYNNNLPSKVTAAKSPKIPKIIHRIWIGPQPFPKKFKNAVESCKKLHPDWQFITWTNKDVENILNIDPQYKWLFNEYKNRKVVYQAQKDVLEYLILSKYGGIYLDADIYCLKNMDELIYKYKFFAGIEPGTRWSKIPVLSNRVVGSSPNNKIMHDTLQTATVNYKNTYAKKNNNIIKRIIRKIFKGTYIKIPNACKTLMSALAQSVVKNGVQPEIIALPATYFDSIFPNTSRYDVLDEIKFKLGVYKNKNKLFNKLEPETISISTDFVPPEKMAIIEKNGG